MIQLAQYYELMKEEFKDNNYLKSCNELYLSSKLRPQISMHLKELGFKCSQEQESVLFFALVDILVVVDKDNNFYYATMCESKLLELKQLGRLLPKNDDLNFSKASSLVKLNTVSTINEYLVKNKFHFIKLNRLNCNSFFFNIGTMNPYPSITNERVYSIDIVTKIYLNTVNLLSRGMYKIGSLICTASPVATSGRQINTCSIDCKLNVKTLDGILEELYLWDISNIENYYESDKVKSLMTGICNVDGVLITLSRDILQRYYGSTYLDFESQGVRERYCLEELFDVNISADLRYYITKYKLFRDSEVMSCKDVFQLREVLRSRLKQIKHDDKYINVRVLVNSGLIMSKHRSYYKKINIDSDIEVITKPELYLPRYFKAGGVTPLGYYYVDVIATSARKAVDLAREEFKRQFGELYNNKVLGLQEGNNVCEKCHPVYTISLETQRKIAEVMSWGYANHFNDYAKYIRSIFDTFKLGYTISDDAIKLLFVNKIAKEVGKCKNVNLVSVGYSLENFIYLVTNCDEQQLEDIVEAERKKLDKGRM